jgi:hypothetical protein
LTLRAPNRPFPPMAGAAVRGAVAAADEGMAGGEPAAGVRREAEAANPPSRLLSSD